jgi:hypothetical protein
MQRMHGARFWTGGCTLEAAIEFHAFAPLEVLSCCIHICKEYRHTRVTNCMPRVADTSLTG